MVISQRLPISKLTSCFLVHQCIFAWGETMPWLRRCNIVIVWSPNILQFCNKTFWILFHPLIFLIPYWLKQKVHDSHKLQSCVKRHFIWSLAFDRTHSIRAFMKSCLRLLVHFSIEKASSQRNSYLWILKAILRWRSPAPLLIDLNLVWTYKNKYVVFMVFDLRSRRNGP